MSDVLPTSRCALCSRCCKKLPGQFVPADLGPDVETRRAKAKELLETGNYSIDWWEGDPREDISPLADDYRYRVEHLRPATKHAVGKVFDASWGGECVFLAADGCSLPREERPTVCKALVPAESGPCTQGMGKQEMSIAWVDDCDWLEEVGEQVEKEKSR